MSIQDLEATVAWRESERIRREAVRSAKEAADAAKKAEKAAVTVPIIDGEVTDETDAEFPIDDTEANLSNALVLLQDCSNMLAVLSDERVVVVSRYLQQEAKELLAEVSVFLDEFDMANVNEAEAKLYEYLPGSKS